MVRIAVIKGAGVRGGNMKQPMRGSNGRSTNREHTGEGTSLGVKSSTELGMMDTERSQRKGPRGVTMIDREGGQHDWD